MGRKVKMTKASVVAVPAVLIGLSQMYCQPLAAQEAVDAVSPPAAATVSPASNNGEEIEEVVVNARKRTENLQSIPVAVTNIGAREIERDNVTNLGNMQTKLPSFTMSASNPKQTNIGVRGIGNNGGNNDGIDPSVGVFLDGVYVGRLGEAAGDYNDLERITLLRGPQGTLFGKNTVGGALLIESQAPTFTPEGKIEGSVGNFNFNEFKANISGPLIDDKLAVRFSSFYTDRDGYIQNLSNQSTFDARHSTGVKLQLLATPTDSLNVRVIAAHDTSAYNTPASIYMTPYPGATTTLASRMAAHGYSLTTNPFDRDVNLDGNPAARTQTNSLTSTINYETKYGTLTSITGYRAWYFQPYNDNDGTQLNAIPQFGTSNDVNQLSQEVRWASPVGGPVDGVVGFYSYYQGLKAFQQQTLGSEYWIYSAAPSNIASSGLASCNSSAKWNSGLCASALSGVRWASRYQTEDVADALFAHGNWHISDSVTLSAGLRETWEWKTVDWTGWNVNTNGFSTTLMNSFGSTVNNVHQSVKDVSLGGELGLDYKPAEDVLTYVKYARGHIAKGVDAPAAPPDAIAAGAKQYIDAEKADSVEIGAKTEWLKRRLQVNVALYDTLISDYQTTAASFAPGSTTAKTYLANVGAIESRGFELEATTRPIPGLRITSFGTGNLAYYRSFHDGQCPLENGSGSICDLTGKQIPYAPKFTAQVNVEYDRELLEGVTGYLVADWNWRSSQNLTLTLSPIGKVDAYDVTSLRAGARFLDDAVDLSLWVNNLFDKDYLVAISANNTAKYYTGTPGAPLALGSTLRVHF